MQLVQAFMTSGFINILMLLILLYLIVNNTIMSVNKTNAYKLVILVTIIVIVAEVATSAFDELGAAYRIPNIIANLIGFTLSTCIPIVLAVVFDEKLERKIRLICLPLVLHFMFLIASVWTGWIFHISMDNQYTRGPFYSFNVITYLYGLALLLVSNYHQSKQFQDTERAFLKILYAILLIGTSIQILFPSLHVTWHCVTLVLVMYYLFQRELQFNYDIITNLLCRHIFENKIESLREAEQVGVVILDLDEFKRVNDNYGHAKGDSCLRTTATILKNSFDELGQCFRIGGDEFCVLAPNATHDAIQSCIAVMLQSLEKARQEDSSLPTISYGYSVYYKSEHKNLLISLQEADEKMYACKKLNCSAINVVK